MNHYNIFVRYNREKRRSSISVLTSTRQPLGLGSLDVTEVPVEVSSSPQGTGSVATRVDRLCIYIYLCIDIFIMFKCSLNTNILFKIHVSMFYRILNTCSNELFLIYYFLFLGVIQYYYYDRFFFAITFNIFFSVSYSTIIMTTSFFTMSFFYSKR